MFLPLITPENLIRLIREIRELIKAGNYDADIAKYIPGVL